MSKWIEGSNNCGLIIFNKKSTSVEQRSNATFEEVVIKIVGTRDAIEIPLPYDKLLKCFTDEELKKKSDFDIRTHQKRIYGGGLILKRYDDHRSFLTVTGFIVETRESMLLSSASGRTIMIEGISIEKLGEAVKSIDTTILCMQ